jgi:hypothetical protein
MWAHFRNALRSIDSSFYLPLLAALLVPGSVQPAQAQTTSLSLDSQAGDFIGQGQSLMVTPNDGIFTATRNFGNGVSISFFGSQLGNFWFLDFAAPGNAPLAVGVYEGAMRFPFQAVTSPGLSVSGQGRGCNTLTGRFEVLEIGFGTAGEVTSFAADFEQHCEGATAALFGSIRINAGPVAQRCRSDVISFSALKALVTASNSSRASKKALVAILEQSEAALQAGRDKSARKWMVFSLEFVTSRLEGRGHKPQPIDPSAVDAFICGASNLLVNMTEP